MADITHELDRLEKRIDRQMAKARRATTISVVIGVVLILILLTYFGIVGGYVRELSDPDDIGRMASTQVVERIPQIRRVIVEQSREQVPIIINGMVDMATRDLLPTWRQTAETTLVETVESEFDRYEAQALEAIDDTFDMHSENIRAIALELQTEDGKASLTQALVEIIDEALDDPAIKTELYTYAIALAELDELMASLADEDIVHTKEQRHLINLLAIMRELGNRTEIGHLGLGDLEVIME